MMIETAPVEVSRHKCLIYDGHPSEQLPVIIPLLINGLRENRRCLYLGNPEMVKMVDSALEEKGVDITREIERGALILSSDRDHLQGGKFDPQAMIAMLRNLIDDAVHDGFQGLCATGDMMWELGTESNFERLLEYEALLEQVFREKPLQGICQYHRNTVPEKAVRDALLTHRSTYIGEVLNQDNLFYVPPELLLESRHGAARDTQGEWMCQQILRIMHAERKRDEALAALRESEAQQRRLAEALAETNRNLEQRIRERTAELEGANKELEAFSYSVSHDLRAPLRHISGFAEMLKEHQGNPPDEKSRHYIDTIMKSVEKMDRLVADLLIFSRMAKSEMHLGEVNLDQLVQEVIRDLQPEVEGREISWIVGALPIIKGDKPMLRQVWVNLIGNAVKYTRTRAKAEIEIGSRTEGGEPLFFVRDNGVGFDPQYAGKLFGVFQRLHRSDEFEGTGIGLANVRRIIHRHGGRTWAQGSIDQGATFYFSLPIIKKDPGSCSQA